MDVVAHHGPHRDVRQRRGVRFHVHGQGENHVGVHDGVSAVILHAGELQLITFLEVHVPEVLGFGETAIYRSHDAEHGWRNDARGSHEQGQSTSFHGNGHVIVVQVGGSVYPHLHSVTFP